MRTFVMCAVVLLGCDSSPASPVVIKQQAVCGQASDETVRIMRGLAPSCEGCHLNGARAYFASVNSFQNLIVADARMVTPGDPESSELIKLLEGRATGAFTKMPIGTKSYAELVADGSATLTVEEVKQWIRDLASQARDAKPDGAAPRITRVKAEQVQRALYQQLGLGYDDFFTNAAEFGIDMAQPRTDETYPFQPQDAYLPPRTTEPRDRFHGLGGGSVVTQSRGDLSPSPTFVLTLTQVSQRWCRLGFRKTGNVALFPAGTAQTTDAANVKATIARWFLHFHGTRASAAEIDAMHSAVWLPLSTTSAEAGWVGLCSAFIRHPDWIFY